jgi:mycofactocin biosynthesis protein MftB
VRGLLIVSAPTQGLQAEFDGPASQRADNGPASSPGGFDPTRAWRLHPQVAVRPEPFGALLYHFGTRKLSFLKNRTILTVVQSLADHPDVRAACRAAGVEDTDQGPYLHALSVLAGSNMLVPGEPRSGAHDTRRRRCRAMR